MAISTNLLILCVDLMMSSSLVVAMPGQKHVLPQLDPELEQPSLPHHGRISVSAHAIQVSVELEKGR